MNKNTPTGALLILLFFANSCVREPDLSCGDDCVVVPYLSFDLDNECVSYLSAARPAYFWPSRAEPPRRDVPVSCGVYGDYDEYNLESSSELFDLVTDPFGGCVANPIGFCHYTNEEGTEFGDLITYAGDPYFGLCDEVEGCCNTTAPDSTWPLCPGSPGPPGPEDD